MPSRYSFLRAGYAYEKRVRVAKRGDERDQPGTRSGNEPNELSIKLSTRYSTYDVARLYTQRYRNVISHFICVTRDRSIVIVNYNMKFRHVNSAPLDTSLYNDPMQ